MAYLNLKEHCIHMQFYQFVITERQFHSQLFLIFLGFLFFICLHLLWELWSFHGWDWILKPHLAVPLQVWEILALRLAILARLIIMHIYPMPQNGGLVF